MGVGRAATGDSADDGRAAASAALVGSDPRLLCVFTSDAQDISPLLAGVSAVAADVPLIGCSSAGQIATDGPSAGAVVVLAFGGSGLSAATAAGTGEPRDAGAAAASCLSELEARPHRLLVLLTDGSAGDQQEIIRGAYEVSGAAVPLVGGCAGGERDDQRAFSRTGGTPTKAPVVAAALGSYGPMGLGVRHGWRKVGEPMLVTHSEGHQVHKLDDRPALDVYLDRLGAPADVRLDRLAFREFVLTHPLGLSRRSTEEQVRSVADADFESRSLCCLAEVPQGGMIWLMEGDEHSVLEATDAACAAALAPLGTLPPRGIVAFDCLARRSLLGTDGVAEEVGRIVEHAQGAPVAGLYTRGEIARTGGTTGFHNKTLVVMALG